MECFFAVLIRLGGVRFMTYIFQTSCFNFGVSIVLWLGLRYQEAELLGGGYHPSPATGASDDDDTVFVF